MGRTSRSNQSSNKECTEKNYIKRDTGSFRMFGSSFSLFKIAVGMGVLAFLSWYIITLVFITDARGSHRVKKEHSMKTVNSELLYKVSNMSDGANFEDFKNILRPFLRTRVPDTEGNTAVRNYISSFLTDLHWTVELDTFRDNTPFGSKSFANVIATSNPHAKRHLVLACHHDSKYFADFDFIGAMDSAVPCAIMLAIAKQLDGYINKDAQQADLALKFLFFDGEEAFVQWTYTDSLYGSRHLAQKMATERVTFGDGSNLSKLEQIDLFVLLDLIGTRDTSFVSFNANDVYYSSFVSAEQRLKSKNLLNYDGQNKVYFKNYAVQGRVEDDHVPFLERGVRILHLISYPFPSVWHNSNDNEANLHYPTINNIMKCVRLFTIEYLGLNV